MIKVSVYYPYSDGAAFDLDYYCTKHMPMVLDLVGDACKGMTVDSGLGGGAPGDPPTFAAIGHVLFDSVEAFQNSFGPHTGQIMGDIPNFTAIQPTIQISDIKYAK